LSQLKRSVLDPSQYFPEPGVMFEASAVKTKHWSEIQMPYCLSPIIAAAEVNKSSEVKKHLETKQWHRHNFKISQCKLFSDKTTQKIFLVWD